MPRRVLVIIPCLNERGSIPAVLAGLRAFAATRPEQFEPVVIDDGSSDGTADVARALGARVVRLCANLGIGGAVQAGLRLAATEGFDCAVQVDGDGQHPAEGIAPLLARLDEADLVVGSRFLQRGGFRSTAARRIGIGWLGLVVRLLTRLEVTDPTSGFRVYGPRALRLFDWRYPYDYPEPEALVLAWRAGLRIVEEPVTMRARAAGQSSIRGLWTLYYMLKVTLALVLESVRNSRIAREQLEPPELPWRPSSASTGSSPPSARSLPRSSSGSSPGSE